MKKSFLMFLSILIGSFALTGCPPKKKLTIDEKPAAEKNDKAEKEESAADLLPGEFEINQDWTEVPALQLVPFEYDSASLEENARLILKSNVAILKKLPKSVTVRLEGHCDDRGTVEYNIALGQRRANAIRSYYITSGLSKSRLETVSFGEERPLCSDQTDACWAKNRRGTTKVKNSEKIKITPDNLK